MPLNERPLIGPAPQYPTPWRATVIRDGLTIAESADGREVARASESEVIGLVVSLVNREVDPGLVNLFEANASLQECSGQLAEARAENERLTRMVEWLANMRGAAGHDSYSAGECQCGARFADTVAWQWHRFNSTT